MPDLSRAEEVMLQQIREGGQDAWNDLVNRYQGRLRAFARTQLQRSADADDAVQETFLSFLRGLNQFEARSSLETYLFTILRRRVIDLVRKSGKSDCFSVCRANNEFDSSATIEEMIPGDVPTGSWYIRSQEQSEFNRHLLRQSLLAAIDELKSQDRLDDLQIIEMIFFARMRNGQIAKIMQISPTQVALKKHRFIQRLTADIKAVLAAKQETVDSLPDDLLTSIWEDARPSCPKRSTLGKHLLGTLDAPWDAYVECHVSTLECQFCIANIDDMRAKESESATNRFASDIMRSSIGFFEANEDSA